MNDWIALAVQASGRSHFGSDFGGFFHSLTHRFSAIAKGIGKGASSVGGALAKVPVVGSGLHAVYDASVAGPIHLATGIASGQRIDRVAMANLKQTVQNARDVAPYAQTIVSVVPGVGTGISGAIGAASAFSSGMPIGKSLIEGAKGALPGGPIARASFDVAMAGVQGKPISDIALAAIPLNPEQKKTLIASVRAARDIAHGKRVDESLYNAGKALLPPAAQSALQTGVALAHAKNLQDLAKKGANGAFNALYKVGAARVSSDATLKAGLAQLKGHSSVLISDAQKGFTAGAGLMAHQVSRDEFNAIRSRLPPDVMKGFDMAIAHHVGSLVSPMPASIPPAQRFGFYVAQGMRGAKPANQKQVKTILLNNAATAKGLIMAKTDTSEHLRFWPRVKHYITSHNRGLHQ